MIDADRIVELARECMGTPFRHQGRLPGKYLDCAGLLVHVLKSLGLPVLDNKGYPGRPFDGQLERIFEAEPSLMRIPKADMRAGDVWVCRIKKAPQHIMIFTGNTVIHTYSNTGRVVEQDAAAWVRHITHVYRIVE
ncbi:MAG: peptidase P60 [Gammaproteobacteria bacterium]|nr:MAG: peptidase P60 [Gammaproteobacteria bacterium]